MRVASLVIIDRQCNVGVIDLPCNVGGVIDLQSGRIKEEADRLIDQHRDLMEDVESQKQQAENMLENGIRQQQIADELLADADYARDVGRKALHKAEMTLQDANDTLKTLKGTDASQVHYITQVGHYWMYPYQRRISQI